MDVEEKVKVTAVPFDRSYHNPGTIPARTGLCSWPNNGAYECGEQAVWTLIAHDKDCDKRYAGCERHLPTGAVVKSSIDAI